MYSVQFDGEAELREIDGQGLILSNKPLPLDGSMPKKLTDLYEKEGRIDLPFDMKSPDDAAEEAREEAAKIKQEQRQQRKYDRDKEMKAKRLAKKKKKDKKKKKKKKNKKNKKKGKHKKKRTKKKKTDKNEGFEIIPRKIKPPKKPNKAQLFHHQFAREQDLKIVTIPFTCDRLGCKFAVLDELYAFIRETTASSVLQAYQDWVVLSLNGKCPGGPFGCHYYIPPCIGVITFDIVLIKRKGYLR